MSMLSRSRSRSRPLPRVPGLSPRATVVAAAWLVVILVVTTLVSAGGVNTPATAAVGNVAMLVAITFSIVACTRAARLRTPASRAWALLALSMGLGLIGQLLYTYDALQTTHAAKAGWQDAVSYLGYAVPLIAALFAFPKPPSRLISRFRVMLDAVVITLGVILVSEATVLRVVREKADLTTMSGWMGLAYPIADVAICSVLFTLGMRQRPRDRATWGCLGVGLVVLVVTDSLYVRLGAEGVDNLTGSPLVAGWIAAPVLIGLSASISRQHTPSSSHRFSLLAQLVPYGPVLGTMVVLGSGTATGDRFFTAGGAVLLLAVAVRQVMIVWENVTLTRDLEQKVALRTADLATMGSIVTSSADAVVGVSADGLVTAWNPAAERLYGHRSEDVLGQPVTFFTAAGVERVRRLLEDARQGRRLDAYELDYEHPDGGILPVAVTVSPVVSDGAVCGISLFGQDITQRRTAAVALETARQEALESSRLKSEFLATMSHEIRTPMNGVIGLTSLLLDTELDETQRQYAEGVRGAGEALLSVINDILDFSKLEAGKVVLDPTEFDPRGLVEDVGALLAPAASSKQLELIVYCPSEVPTAVLGDPGRIRQILLNLASNAVKFTPTGEVAVKVSTVPAPAGQARLRFEVADTGIGINPGDQSRLFESFSQADASTTRRFGGTGLGLAISRSLVDVMGGSIGVQSELGAGSTFWFEIPLPLAQAGAEPLPSSDLLSDLRVLVVDDNATNRTILDAQLRSWRMHPELVADATTALARLRARAAEGRPFDLAVLDMLMPGTDGLELATQISTDPALGELPMLMLTSSLQVPPEVFSAAGIGQWLTKPVRGQELFDKLMRLMAPIETDLNERKRTRQHLPLEKAPDLGRILVVEDNLLNQLVAEGVLSRLGYQSRCVNDGLQALDALRAGSYAAVLMDCHMPVMDGYTATEQIRRRQAAGELSYLPVIAMTAGALAEDRDRCLNAGMDDYISKPVNFEALEVTLARWVGRTSGADPEPGAATPEDGDELWTVATLDNSRLADLADLRAADGTSMLDIIVDTFLERSGNRLEALRTAAAAGDAGTLADAAHELRGTSATIGADRVAQLCGTMERTARQQGSVPASAELDRLAVELTRASTALRQVSPVLQR
ncbi:MAG: hypothetical protein JWP61_1202 [Friedmanniella sp.]|nr:hypothetical protein [Friedmanniella sp.]